MIGHHTGLICRDFRPLTGVAGERPEFNVKPPLWVSTCDLSSRLSPEVFSTRDTSAIQRGFEIRVFSLQMNCQRLSNLTRPLVSYATGNSVPTCGLRLRPSR